MQRRRPYRSVLPALCLVVPGCAPVGRIQPNTIDKTETMMTPTSVQSDRDAILEHVHGLFRAYVAQDREAIRRGHTADWRGFQVKSTRIVRGIDEYMIAADASLKNAPGTRYKLAEVEIEVHGDLAIVYYTADYWFRDASGEEKLMPLRSVDLYRREPEGWNQFGSNISFRPESESWQPQS